MALLTDFSKIVDAMEEVKKELCQVTRQVYNTIENVINEKYLNFALDFRER